MARKRAVLPIVSPRAVRFSQSAYEFVASAPEPARELRASFGHPWTEIDATIAWDRSRYSVGKFLTVKAVKPKSGSWVIAIMGRIGAFDGHEHNCFAAF